MLKYSDEKFLIKFLILQMANGNEIGVENMVDQRWERKTENYCKMKLKC